MTENPDDLINGMCMTWRHDFGLDRPSANKDGIIGWSDGLAMGMTSAERDGLRMQMRQLYQHHILPAVLQARSQAYEECAKIADENMNHGPKDAAQAIRQHSQKGEDVNE
jgi:membrane protease subunit (stomatin/prohibitin family)